MHVNCFVVGTGHGRVKGSALRRGFITGSIDPIRLGIAKRLQVGIFKGMFEEGVVEGDGADDPSLRSREVSQLRGVAAEVELDRRILRVPRLRRKQYLLGLFETGAPRDN